MDTFYHVAQATKFVGGLNPAYAASIKYFPAVMFLPVHLNIPFKIFSKRTVTCHIAGIEENTVLKIYSRNHGVIKNTEQNKE